MSEHPTLAVFDVETYSGVDLTKVGAARYARDPSTDVLCLSFNNPFSKSPSKVHLWVPGDPPPISLTDVPAQGGYLAAYNVQFDMNIWRWVLVERYGWTWPGMDAFYDLQADARCSGLPGKLEECVRELDVGQKNMIGHKLMLTLCKPWKPIKANSDPRRKHTPEALEELYDYCRDDTKAELALSKALPRIRRQEKEIRDMDLRMNERGIGVDKALVKAILDVIETIRVVRREELSELTDGAVETENQFKNIYAFSKARGYPVESVAKDKVTEYLDDPNLTDPALRRAFEIRQEIGKSSLAKLDKIMLSVCDDGRLRNMMGYHGAHTGRWASYIVQLQNLPQGVLKYEPDEGINEYDLARELVLKRDFDMLQLCYGDDQIMDVCVSLIRACLCAQEGRELLVSDFSAIEGRVLAWLAGEEHVLQAYREGKRMYCVAASDIFHLPYAEIFEHRKGKHSKKDKIGKTCELALGFQGGYGSMIAFGADKLGLSDEEIDNIVAAWRNGRPATKALWHDVNQAALSACRHKKQWFKAGKMTFIHSGKHLRMRLPSGRVMTYRKAHIKPKPAPWDKDQMVDAIHYWGVDSYTKKWKLLDTYGGKLAQNATQAVARELMALAMIRAEKKRLHPVLTVHDEIVIDEKIGRVTCEELDAIMTELPRWAMGLPIGADSWQGSYYRK